MDRANLANLSAFVAIADQRSFRGAEWRFAVTLSAASHSMRQLEERPGVRLLHRTTRSVSATDAGQRLLHDFIDRLRVARGPASPGSSCENPFCRGSDGRVLIVVLIRANHCDRLR